MEVTICLQAFIEALYDVGMLDEMEILWLVFRWVGNDREFGKVMEKSVLPKVGELLVSKKLKR